MVVSRFWNLMGKGKDYPLIRGEKSPEKNAWSLYKLLISYNVVAIIAKIVTEETI